MYGSRAKKNKKIQTYINASNQKRLLEIPNEYINTTVFYNLFLFLYILVINIEKKIKKLFRI